MRLFYDKPKIKNQKFAIYDLYYKKTRDNRIYLQFLFFSHYLSSYYQIWR